MTAITTVPGGPFAAGSTVIYTGKIVDASGAGIPAADINTLTLTFSVTATGAIVNGILQQDILNTGRGTLDSQGNLTITFGPTDTAMPAAPGATTVMRSMVIDWTFNGGTAKGRHEPRLTFIALTEPV